MTGENSNVTRTRVRENEPNELELELEPRKIIQVSETRSHENGVLNAAECEDQAQRLDPGTRQYRTSRQDEHCYRRDKHGVDKECARELELEQSRIDEWRPRPRPRSGGAMAGQDNQSANGEDETTGGTKNRPTEVQRRGRHPSQQDEEHHCREDKSTERGTSDAWL